MEDDSFWGERWGSLVEMACTKIDGSYKGVSLFTNADWVTPGDRITHLCNRGGGHHHRSRHCRHDGKRCDRVPTLMTLMSHLFMCWDGCFRREKV
jgi:hypothetical protein